MLRTGPGNVKWLEHPKTVQGSCHKNDDGLRRDIFEMKSALRNDAKHFCTPDQMLTCGLEG